MSKEPETIEETEEVKDQESDERPDEATETEGEAPNAEDLSEWGGLKEKAGGFTPDQYHYLAWRGQQAVQAERQAQEEAMFAEHEHEKKKAAPGNGDRDEGPDEDDEPYVSRKTAEELAARKALEIIDERERERDEAQRVEAEHQKLLDSSGITNSVIRDMLRARAEKLQNAGISLEVSYSEAIRVLKSEGVVDQAAKIRTGVRNTAALKRARSSTGTGGAPPAAASRKTEPEFPSEDLQRYMTPTEADRYVSASADKQRQILEQVKARAAMRRD